MNIKIKHLAVATCLMLLQLAAHAAGLGKLNVLSGLGEPLKAEIEIMSASAKELSSLTAAIASNGVYTAHGIEKPSSHQTVNIVLAKNSKGQPILKLNSSQPITDAFLDMLIQVDWASGRLLREYTVLLDPPGYKSEFKPNQSVVTLPKASAPSQVVTKSMALPSPVPSSVVKRQTTQTYQAPKAVGRTPSEQAATMPAPATLDYAMPDYMTQKGDTLYAIANRMKPAGVSLEQMLVGLYKENQRAFSGKNMNRLKVGQIIRAPSSGTLSAISRKQARKKVRVHTANWRAYKNRLAGVVKESEYADSASSAQSNGGKVVSAEDRSEPGTTGPKDVVKLSAGDAKAVKSLEDKVASLEEEMTAKDNAVKEAESRTADLEKQIADMQKLIALKSDAMTKIQNDAIEQQKLEQQAPDAEVKKVVKAEEKVVEKPVKAPEMVKEAAKTAGVEKEAEMVASAVEKAKKPEVVAKPKPAKKPKPKPVVVPEPVIEEPSFIDSLLGTVTGGELDVPKLGMGAGALALLGGSWWFLRNRRRSTLTSFEEGIMTTGGLKANTVFGNTAGGTVDTGDTSFLTDFSSNTAGAMIDSHDVDPVAEAEVYMAYGRDAQAEEILKDAIAKEPERYELHLKLLEIYQNNKDTGAFEAVAGEMYTKLGAGDATWQKIAAMGLSFDESNPLYSTGADAQVATSDVVNTETESASTPLEDSMTKRDEPVEIDMDAAVPESNVTNMDADAAPAEALNLDANIVEEVVADIPDSNFDLDIGELNLDTEEVAELPDAVEESVEEISLDAVETVEEVAVAEAPETLDFEMPSLSVEEPSTETVVEAAPEPEADVEVPMMPEIEFDVKDEPSEKEAGLDTLNDDFPSLAVDAGSDVSNETTDITLDISEEGDADAGTLDLSGISLDIGDEDNSDLNTNAIDSVVTDEPADVETKLDLVQAYIDMEDKIGAKELLDEVMNEGGENQKKRASELLAKIA